MDPCLLLNNNLVAVQFLLYIWNHLWFLMTFGPVNARLVFGLYSDGTQK